MQIYLFKNDFKLINNRLCAKSPDLCSPSKSEVNFFKNTKILLKNQKEKSFANLVSKFTIFQKR